MSKDDLTSAESLRKTRTYGKFRCHNPTCMGRIEVPPGAKQCKCSVCGMEFRVSWVKAGFPRIRGPVWDVNRKLAQEAVAKREAEASRKKRK
jgi:hypothetical protein